MACGRALAVVSQCSHSVRVPLDDDLLSRMVRVVFLDATLPLQETPLTKYQLSQTQIEAVCNYTQHAESIQCLYFGLMTRIYTWCRSQLTLTREITLANVQHYLKQEFPAIRVVPSALPSDKPEPLLKLPRAQIIDLPERLFAQASQGATETVCAQAEDVIL